ncbi:hypothetical protein KMP13_01140 [Epibacterium ulvae]|uniref:hypothetical protein n=1 Tax=Epibacterium ulvae TaxID=1156985 RepID=UPI001BFCC82A|nr:hypothetical protein [Epibacterium ulvae]MBT8152521.1 hypothetical protein [Epibacterium ulvae]
MPPVPVSVPSVETSTFRLPALSDPTWTPTTPLINAVAPVVLRSVEAADPPLINTPARAMRPNRPGVHKPVAGRLNRIARAARDGAQAFDMAISVENERILTGAKGDIPRRHRLRARRAAVFQRNKCIRAEVKTHATGGDMSFAVDCDEMAVDSDNGISIYDHIIRKGKVIPIAQCQRAAVGHRTGIGSRNIDLSRSAGRMCGARQKRR